MHTLPRGLRLLSGGVLQLVQLLLPVLMLLMPPLLLLAADFWRKISTAAGSVSAASLAEEGCLFGLLLILALPRNYEVNLLACVCFTAAYVLEMTQ